jgi:hypothetical protein
MYCIGKYHPPPNEKKGTEKRRNGKEKDKKGKETDKIGTKEIK